MSEKIKVGVIGYGVIGKRVADAVSAQEDMELVGVADIISDMRIEIAQQRGYPIYCWDENFKDPNAYPALFKDSWFAGTGRTIENEIFFNNAQQALMQHDAGIFAMSEEGIEKNLAALAAIGINGSRAMFDTTLLEEV